MRLFGSRTVVDRPLAVVNAVNTASPALWYVHVDHLNRPIKMTDTTKASVWDAQCPPWGNVFGRLGIQQTIGPKLGSIAGRIGADARS